jgi:hypothetical protein
MNTSFNQYKQELFAQAVRLKQLPQTHSVIFELRGI